MVGKISEYIKIKVELTVENTEIEQVKSLCTFEAYCRMTCNVK